MPSAAVSPGSIIYADTGRCLLQPKDGGQKRSREDDKKILDFSSALPAPRSSEPRVAADRWVEIAACTVTSMSASILNKLL